MVFATDAVAHPGTVMVHALNAPATQLTVVSTDGLDTIAFEAVTDSLQCLDFVATSETRVQLHVEVISVLPHLLLDCFFFLRFQFELLQIVVAGVLC